MSSWGPSMCFVHLIPVRAHYQPHGPDLGLLLPEFTRHSDLAKDEFPPFSWGVRAKSNNHFLFVFSLRDPTQRESILTMPTSFLSQFLK